MAITYNETRGDSRKDRDVNRSLLFIPGPVMVADRVMAAMGKPLVDHRGPEYAALLGRIAEGMKPIFGTTNDVVLLGASGTGGLEAAVASLFRRTARLLGHLAAPIGVFGKRLIAIAQTIGATVDVLETADGAAVDPQALRAKLAAAESKRYDGILLTHNETSTGAQNDMAALAAVTKPYGALVVVDSVSGLAASEFRMDDWGFDIVVAASQKALAAPPGIAMVAVSERAWAKMDAPGSTAFSLDLRRGREFAKQGQTPWTPPVSIAFALDAALALYDEEGAERVWARHARYARAIRAAAGALGLRVFSQEGAHSGTVVAIEAPAGVDVAALRATLRDERGIVMGGGQAHLKGKIFRMGTMGAISETDVLGAIGALEVALLERDVPIHVGSGMQAALRVFLDEAGIVPTGAMRIPAGAAV